MLDSAAHHHQNTRYFLEELCSILPVEFQRLVESVSGHLKAVLAAKVALTKSLCLLSLKVCAGLSGPGVALIVML